MAFMLTSTAFKPGGEIPRRHTCDGDDLSPPLSWTDPPEGVTGYALVVDDPDAPGGTFTHWLLWDVPGSATGLDEGQDDTDPAGTAGRNDFGRAGYGGPCPPRGHGAHRYRFHLHALGRPLGLSPGSTRSAVDAALAAASIGSAMLVGRYERQP